MAGIEMIAISRVGSTVGLLRVRVRDEGFCETRSAQSSRSRQAGRCPPGNATLKVRIQSVPS